RRTPRNPPVAGAGVDAAAIGRCDGAPAVSNDSGFTTRAGSYPVPDGPRRLLGDVLGEAVQRLAPAGVHLLDELRGLGLGVEDVRLQGQGGAAVVCGEGDGVEDMQDGRPLVVGERGLEGEALGRLDLPHRAAV